MKKLLLLLFAGLFVSCASNKIDSNFSPVYVTNTSKFQILPPQYMVGSVDSAQRMSAKFGHGEKANEFQFDVYVISDSSQLSMTIFNEFGTTMASLFYDGAALDFDSAIFPKELKPEYIVSDFQFCLYSVPDLQDALSQIGVTMEVSSQTSDDGITTEIRRLSKKKKSISKITKTLTKNPESGAEEIKSIEYENFLRGYGYTLRSVE
ncbi:MAG: DUF3261 domain-containing protein [Treponema sp.]|nr:DUF3261 domain-containing protein [Treponema sp.]